MHIELRAETLREYTLRTMRRMLLDALPGLEAYLEENQKAAAWVAEQEAKIDAAVLDDDRILTERAIGTWRKAIERVNEILAEQYRQANAAAETWELRYLKWMTKVLYVHCDSPMGEFFLLPRMPARRPKAAHWYTVDEMIDMLHPTVAAAITGFGTLPVRPDAAPRAGAGDKVLHIDATGPQVELHYEMRGVVHGRERIR